MIILLAIETASETAFLCVGEATAYFSTDGPARFLECLPAISLDHVGDCVGFAGGVVVPGKRINKTVSLAQQLTECCNLLLQVLDAHWGHGFALQALALGQCAVAFDFGH